MEDKVSIREIAEESGATHAEVIAKAADLSIILKSPQSKLTYEQAEEIVNYIVTGKSDKIKTTSEPKAKNSSITTNTVAKKTQPKPKVEVISEVSVEEIETVVSPKEDTIIEEDTKIDEVKQVQSIAEGEAPLKRGKLTIVKKRRPIDEVVVSKYEQPKKQSMKSMSELFGNSPENKDDYSQKQQPSKIKKQIKKAPPKAHLSGEKIDVFVHANDAFKESEDSILGEEVVLYDMDLLETSKFLQDTPKQTENIRTTKPSAFGNVPRGLKRSSKKKKYIKKTEAEEITSVTIPEECRVYEFAEKIGKSTADVIGKLFMLGMMVTKNDFLGNDEIEILGEEYDIEITIKDELEEVNYEETYDDEVIDKSNFVNRPPVVTIMGHVDHGKTSLLDKIRKSRVAAGEAGGITQHISAYTVTKNGKEITFVDTPGHEAFSSMRIRGANITDIVILVVAADDGVKPQTIESIKAAKDSGAPIIVAVNKIDKETANMDMVKAGMAEHGIMPTEWGGDYEFIGVSALSGAGIEELLENILIQSELLELQADPTSLAKATVIEGSTVKGRGAVATVIVQNGTLKVGDNIVADTTYGRVKALLDDSGKPVTELGLSKTGQVVGLNDVPNTGVSLVALESASEAKAIATTRADHARAKELSKSTKVSLEEMSNLIAEGKIKALPVIIKADAGGSLEAIKISLEDIKNDEVKVKIVSAGVGGITEADVALASASDDCIIIGFNVRPTGEVKVKAKSSGVEIRTYSIIYNLIDEIKDTLSGMMSAIVIEENTGQARVRETFVVPKVGTVAGCIVSDGKVVRGGRARLIRDGIVIYTGNIDSLKRFKDDVKEVANGFECGIMFKKFNDVKVGDYIETFIEHKEAQTV
ncbi:MAG: translation initiation factor IF-2 [Arcobacteraceae bacterium]|jgi:translation initiation factor IF-2|nr:translation initiation factor IF-2 [Arcobacteraceae bacterium]